MCENMDLKNLKIKKTTYSFDIDKNYNYEKEFEVINKNPFQILLENIFKKSNKKEDGHSGGKTPIKKGINPLLIAGGISVLLLLIMGIWIYTTLNTTLNYNNNTPTINIEKIVEMKILTGNEITYGNKKDGLHSLAIKLDKQIEGYESSSLTINTYSDEPPYQIYLLSEPRDESQSNNYNDFEYYLREYLKKYGLQLNKITTNDLDNLGMGSLIIIPTGRIPSELLDPASTNNINKLTERGATILYIGKQFTSSVKKNGDIAITNKDWLKSIGVTFTSVENGNENQISTLKYMVQPQYIASSTNKEMDSSVEYGTVSIIKHKSKGCLIFVPQTIDTGWEKPSDAAYDTKKIILEKIWLEKTGSKTYKNVGYVENTSTIKTYYSNPVKELHNYVEVILEGKDKKNESWGRISYISIDKEYNGELYITDGSELLPTSISGEDIRIKADLKENQNKKIYPYILIEKNGNEVYKQSLSNVKINTNTDSDFYIPIDVIGGEYTVYILDENGEIYTAGYINSKIIEIKRVSIKDNIFIYSFRINNKPVSLREINVSIDNGKLGEYYFERTSQITIDINDKLGVGGKIEPGIHYINFKIGKITARDVYPIYSGNEDSIFTSPLFFGTIVVIIIIMGAGKYLAGMKKPLYYLDIPDFPPTEFKKIVVPKKIIIDVFDKENEYHKWKNNPLTIDEIRNGLKKTFYKGKQLITSNFNLNYILEKLIQKGLIAKEIGYYIPTKWIGNNGNNSIRYLATYRKLRDICVVNAIPFTTKNINPEYMSKITLLGQEIYVHSFEEDKLDEILINISKNIKNGLNIVLVKNRYEKSKLNEILTAPNEIAGIIKFETEGKTVLIMTLDEFEKMIIEMKV